MKNRAMGRPKPSDRLKNLSPLQSRAHSSPRVALADEVEAQQKLEEGASARLKSKSRRRGCPGGRLWEWASSGARPSRAASPPVYPVAQVQIMPSAMDSVVNTIASGLASASKLAPPEMKAQAESVFRSALSATWGECLAKDISQERAEKRGRNGRVCGGARSCVEAVAAAAQGRAFQPDRHPCDRRFTKNRRQAR